MADSKIEWQWDHPGGADSFQLTENGTVIVKDIVVPYFSLMMTGYPDGLYTYTVEAVTQFGISAPSNAVEVNFITPVAVQNLRYTIA